MRYEPSDVAPTRTTTSFNLGVISDVDEMTTPDAFTAGSAKTVLMPAGSVMRREYASPLTGTKENRPQPSCSVWNVANFLPAALTTPPAISAAFRALVRSTPA